MPGTSAIKILFFSRGYSYSGVRNMIFSYLLDLSGLFNMLFSRCLLHWMLFVRIERLVMLFISFRLNVRKIFKVVTSVEEFP